MSYGSLKVDELIYSSGGSEEVISLSGISSLASGDFGNINATGTITAITGIFTTTLSGTNVTGDAAGFTTVTGTTVTGTNANFVNATFTSAVTGTTVTGTTVNFVTGTFSTVVSGARITGGTAGFTTLTGTTVTGTTANFSSGNFTGTLSGGVTRDSKGDVRAIPQNSQTTSYVLASGDIGRHIFTTAGVTVPSGVFAIGDAITIYNNTTGNITITQGTNVTLRQAGASGTGNRTLAQRGLATVLCVSGASGTEFVVAGNVT